MKKLLVNKFSTQKLNAFLKDNHGFTLIEIIFTIIFASIALLATMTMMSTSMLGSMNVEFMNTAANLANVKMESLFSDKKTRGYGYIQESNYPYETNVDDTGDLIEGPIHSNDQISIVGNPVFMGKVTSTASSFNQGSPFNPDFQGGYQLGVPPVIFPTEQDVLDNYWSENTEPPP